MKKVFLTLAAAIFALTASAAPTVLNPVADYAFRTNGTVNATQQDDPTGWQSGFPKDAPETVECTYSSKMWGQQMYDVSNIDWSTVKDVTLTLYNQNAATYRLGAWMYPNADWTEADQQTWTEDQCPIVENFKEAVGAYPGHQTTSKTYLAYADESNSDTLKVKQVITFSGNALTTLKNNVVTKGEKKYLNFIITFRETDASISSNRKVVYYALNTTDATQKPVLTINYNQVVATNLTTGIEYYDLATAVAAADSADVLQLENDATVSGNRIENTVALTIQGKTGAEKIFRDTKLNNLVFLPKAELTLKDLVLDGQNVNRQKAAVEAADAKVIFDNVTIQNFQRTDDKQTQGIITIKKNGKALFTDVTFANNAVLAGYGDVFVGKDSAVVFNGNNTIPNGIYIEKKLAIVDNTTTHTQPLTIRVDSTRAIGDSVPVVYNCSDVNKYNVVVAGQTGVLATKDNYLYINDIIPTAVDQQAVEPKQGCKVMENGQLYIIHNGVRYNILGGQIMCK